MSYDFIVVGSGPAGQKGAIAASKLGKRVALVERQRSSLGGVCLHTGTIPSKTMREAILHLTGFRHRDVYGDQFRRKRHITMESLRRKLDQVTCCEREIIDEHLDRNGVDVISGVASFVDDHTITVKADSRQTQLTGDYFLLAPGTKPTRPAHIPFDGRQVFDSDEILKLDKIPRSMIVVGGGVIGIEYAIMFATLGVQVTVVDGRERLLDFCDREIIDTLLHHARSLEMMFRLGEEVTQIRRSSSGTVVVELESQKRLVADTVLFSVGRIGDTDSLNLEAAGLSINSRGRLETNEHLQTVVPHVYAVGDVIGFPSLASTSMQQGRRAASHAFGHPLAPCDAIPYGLFTIPEISMIGHTEEQLTADRVPYEVGHAHFNETARGHIIGDHNGLLKLLFHRRTRKLLGVHIIGESATELLHIGQAVLSFGGTIDYFCDTIFNFPTLAECYKVAAFDGRNRLCLDDDTLMSNDSIDLSTNVEATLAQLDHTTRRDEAVCLSP
ncbi:MAG: Si-specific NAD(P)(+) transhydrogenase [Planctomycetaceae bacterium]|nr:Si-specific NAD(P)(+) transhydrogenase [Planctomycetaceae bacterium]